MSNKDFLIKKRKWIILLILSIFSYICFFCMGNEVPMIAADTGVYTVIDRNDGVMPVYPLYTYVFRLLFGDSNAFDAMVIFQGILSSIVIICFTMYIQSKCKRTFISTVIVYCCSVAPFVAYLPQANISQMILTESIAFPLTYIMILFMLIGYEKKRLFYNVCAVITAIILYLTRSQLMIAILFASMIFFFQLLRLHDRTLRMTLVQILLTMTVSFIAIIVPYRLFIGYLNHVVPVLNKSQVIQEIYDKSNPNDTKVYDSSQFDRLIMNRGIVLLEDGDAEKYYSDEYREAFNVVIQAIRLKNPNGLIVDNPVDWSRKWDDQGLLSEKNVDYAVEGLTLYLSTKYPDKSDVEIWGHVKSYLIMFAKDAIVHHMGVYVYLFFRLLFAGIQASIFVQPPRMFVVSEIITLLLIALTVAILIKTRKKDSIEIYLLRISVLGIVLYSGIVSAVHQPLQRYLIYFQGMYYIGLYTVIMDTLSEKNI